MCGIVLVLPVTEPDVYNVGEEKIALTLDALLVYVKSHDMPEFELPAPLLPHILRE